MGSHIVENPSVSGGSPGFLLSFIFFTSLRPPWPCVTIRKNGRGVNTVNDGNKVRHNLALAYANNKLQIALQRGEHPQNLDLDDPAQAACALAHWYRACLDELIELADDELFSPYSMD